MKEQLPKTVEEISKISMTGNIIPQRWFRYIRFSSGKPDLLGIMILSDIIYWYRATEVRDENTGQIKHLKKKFKADKLQRHYQHWADQFGVSKRQVQDAARRLREAGLITTELRIVTSETGIVLSNVPFFEPIPEAIKLITFGPTEIERDRSCNQIHDPMQLNVIGHVTEYETYTENTTETTTENTT